MVAKSLTTAGLVLVFILFALLLCHCRPKTPSATMPAAGEEFFPPGLSQLFPELSRPVVQATTNATASAFDRTTYAFGGYSSLVTGDFDGDGSAETAFVIRQEGSVNVWNECYVGIVGFKKTTAYRMHLFKASRPSCPALRLIEDSSLQGAAVVVAYSGVIDDCDILYWSGSGFLHHPCSFPDEDDGFPPEDHDD